jgi:hypothetical protein
VRPGPLAVVSLIAAAVGAALVLVAARAAGWLHAGSATTTVVQVSTGSPAVTPVVAAKPLAGNGFAPAQIYRARSAGVVTIYSTFPAIGSTSASAGLGSKARPRGTLMSPPCTNTSASGSRGPCGGGLHLLSARRRRSAAISAAGRSA